MLSKIIIYLLFLIIFVIGHLIVSGSYIPDDLLRFVAVVLLVIFFCEIYSILLNKMRIISDLFFTYDKQKEDLKRSLMSEIESEYSSENIAMKIQQYFRNKLQMNLSSFYIKTSLSLEEEREYIDLLSSDNVSVRLPDKLYCKALQKKSCYKGPELRRIFVDKNEPVMIPFIFAKQILAIGLVDSHSVIKGWKFDLINMLIREVGIILDRVRIYQELLIKKQEHIKEEERSRVYKSLAGSIAHEIRNPLNSINVLSNQINDHLRDLDNEIMEMVKESERKNGGGDR